MPTETAPSQPSSTPPQKHGSTLRAVKKNAPLHLYLREESYYFRLRIPKQYIFRCPCKEIRFSLQTDSLKEAKRKAALVTAALHSLFQEKAVVSPDDMAKMKRFLHDQFPDHFTHKVVEYPPTVHALHAWLNENGHEYTLKEVAVPLQMQFASMPLPDFALDRLSEFLEGGSEKKPLVFSDIKKRLVGYFRYALENDAQKPSSRTQREERPLQQPLFDMLTPKHMGISTEVLYSAFHQQCRAAIDTPPLLCLYALDYLEKFVEADLFESVEISKVNYLQIINEYCKFSVLYFEILQARLKNDYSKEHHLLSLPYESYPRSAKPQDAHLPVTVDRDPRRKKVKKLSEFLENYLQTKVEDGKKDPRYIPELRNHLELFIRIISDKPINMYSRDDFRDFRKTLFKLPPNFTKRKELRDKTIQEIIDMKCTTTMQEKTVNTYTIDVSALFNWFVIEGYLEQNYATQLGVKVKKAEIDSRDAFTPEDLKVIFKKSALEAYKTSKAPSRYWVPWIGLYTGMRIEEICQLHCSDIYKVDGLWVIDVNNKPSDNGMHDKKLKTENASRIIPMHNHLQELGLLQYHAQMKAQGERLFPDLKPLGVRKQYGKIISKDFGPFIRKLGIKGNKTFHSLRHTFSDFFKKRLQHNAIFEQVFGHTHEKLATRRYGSRFTPQECYDSLISHLDYGLQ